MYAELLNTPHPIKSTGEQQQLLDVIQPEQIREAVGRMALGRPEMVGASRVYAADMISREVNKALWFPEIDKSTGRDDFAKYDLVNPVGTSELVGKQFTNCYGFSIVLSECLSALDIPHFVGFGAGHAFVVVPEVDDSRTNLFYVDALWPDLNQDMTAAIRPYEAVRGIEDELAAFGRSSFKVNAGQFARNAGTYYDSLIVEKRWPLIRYSDYTRLDQGSKDEIFLDRLQREYFIVSIFEAERGRQILDDYSSFQQLCAHGHYETAAQKIHAIGDGIPEIDVRSDKHMELQRVALALVQGGGIEAAQDVIDSYFSGFKVSEHPNVDILQGDILRKISARTNRSSFAKTAHDKYLAAQSKQIRPTVNGRIAAALALQKQLADVDMVPIPILL